MSPQILLTSTATACFGRRGLSCCCNAQFICIGAGDRNPRPLRSLRRGRQVHFPDGGNALPDPDLYRISSCLRTVTQTNRNKRHSLEGYGKWRGCGRGNHCCQMAPGGNLASRAAADGLMRLASPSGSATVTAKHSALRNGPVQKCRDVLTRSPRIRAAQRLKAAYSRAGSQA